MPDKAGHTAFVTGGTGFVGSHLVEYLFARGFSEVRCLVRSDLKFLTGLPITVVAGDLSDPSALETGVSGVDYVFHTAAQTRSENWEDLHRANVDGTRHLLEAVRNANPDVLKVLITSSLAVVGSSSSVADEQTPLQPISRYGRSKMLMEQAAAPFFDAFPTVVVRPPSVYGPRESDIFTFFQSISRGICPIVGMGKDPAISLVHVRDLVSGMVQAALSDRSAGETYFLGSPRAYSWREIRDASATALGRRVLTVPIPPAFVGLIGAISESIGRLTHSYPPLNREKAAEIKSACKMCDHSKAADQLGYAPTVDLWEGIRETIEWYRKERWL